MRKTIEFSQEMRKADPTIQLIGWGDSGWAPEMIEKAGGHIDYLAFHPSSIPANRSTTTSMPKTPPQRGTR